MDLIVSRGLKWVGVCLGYSVFCRREISGVMQVYVCAGAATRGQIRMSVIFINSVSG
jgi:hypothetical protein